MSCNQYYIYTLDGKRILNGYSVELGQESPYGLNYSNFRMKYEFDVQKESIVKYKELRNEIALFYQINQLISNRLSDDKELYDDFLKNHENSLSDQIIFIDFDEVFKADIELDYMTHLDKQLSANVKTVYVSGDENTANVSESKDVFEDDYEDIPTDDADELNVIYDNEWLECKELAESDFYDDYVNKTHTRPYGERLRELFSNGITLIINGKKTHFVPFDKSQSMSRGSKVSFVNSDIKYELTQRLNIGIPFEELKLNLSKFSAYRGLYLSDANRVDDVELDECKLIVLEDDLKIGDDRDEEATVVTGEQDAHNPNKYKTVIKNKKKSEIIGQIFDGEGLVSPFFSNEICKGLSLNSRIVNSFQMRMPFMKGMIHSVDFHGFVREYATYSELPEGFCDGNCSYDILELYKYYSYEMITAECDRQTKEIYLVEDYYGVRRNIFDAHIVITNSMFKAASWLKAGLSIRRDLSETEKSDPMKLYFDGFNKFSHGLYISNTNLPYYEKNLIQMNYQFFNTLKISKTGMEALVSEHMTYARNPLMYYKTVNRVESIKLREDGSKITVYNAPAWQNAVLNNPGFVRNKFVEPKIENMIKRLTREIAYGHILVSGQMRYLSRDLLYFLVYLLHVSDGEGLGSEILSENEFDLPGINEKDNYTSDYYPIFRNPHLSRNEQCALKLRRYKAHSVRNKYFGHLKGIIMVSHDSLAPAALGGADFDGDIVKIINNDVVRDSVLNNVYEKCETGEICEGKNYDGIQYKRRLPIIVIPSNKGDDRYGNETSPYYLIYDTFSTQVGLLSNMALKIKEKECTKENINEINCATCTILVGLEIDACKTGFHPDLEDIKEAVFAGKVKKEDYQDTETDVYEISLDEEDEPDDADELWEDLQDEEVSDFSEEENDAEGEETVDIPEKLKKVMYYYEVNKKKRIRYTFVNEENRCPLYYLPYLFFENYKEYKQIRSDLMDKYDSYIEKKGRSYIYFTFEENKINDMPESEISKLIKAYSDIVQIINEVGKSVDVPSKEYRAIILNKLIKRYSKEKSEELYFEIRTKLLEYAESLHEIHEILKRLNNSQWPFLIDDNDKWNCLSKILSCDENELRQNKCFEKLMDYCNRGYQLLYLFIMDIREMYYIENKGEIIDIKAKELAAEKKISFDETEDGEKSYLEIFIEDYKKRKQDGYLNNEIKKYYLNAVKAKSIEMLFEKEENDLCENEKTFLLEIIYRTLLKLKQVALIWDFFDAKTILNSIIVKEWEA